MDNNQIQSVINDITERNIPIVSSDCAISRKRKIWKREQLSKEINSLINDIKRAGKAKVRKATS